MSEVTIEPKGSSHSYVLADGKWIASCLPEYADALKRAVAQQFDAASDNRANSDRSND